jgi:hypothetical protein
VLPANLHAADWQLVLWRRTSTITNNNGDMIFVNEVQSKPTSSGYDYRRSSPTTTPTALDDITPHSPLRVCRYVIIVTTSAPLSYLWGSPSYRVWHGLYPILLIQLKSHRNRTVQIFDTISNKADMKIDVFFFYKLVKARGYSGL